jgi:hypothetical protein
VDHNQNGTTTIPKQPRPRGTLSLKISATAAKILSDVEPPIADLWQNAANHIDVALVFGHEADLN